MRRRAKTEMFLNIFKTVLLFLFLHNTGAVEPQNSTGKKPNLEVKAGHWKNVTIPGVSSRAYYTPRHGYDMTLKCQASFPIRWNFTGFLHPAEYVYMPAPKRNLATNVYTISVHLLSAYAKGLDNVGASIRVSCESVKDPSIFDDVLVFIRGNSTNTLLNSSHPVPANLLDTKVLPCSTKDPTASTLLYKLTDNEDEEPVPIPTDSITYHPAEGFRFTQNQIFNGTYVCRQGSSSVTFTANASPPSQNEYTFIPISDSIKVFTEDTIEIECKSSSGRQVSLQVKEASSENLTISYSSTTDGVGARISTKIFAGAGTNESLASITTKVICVTDQGEMLREWEIKFVETPELFLDSYSSEVNCFSRVIPKTVETVWCSHGLNCGFMQRCVEHDGLCNIRTLKHFVSTGDNFCWIPSLQQERDCNFLPYYHYSGIARCKVEGLVKQWEYFVALDSKRYYNWRDAPIQELVRMDKVRSILSGKESNRFFCSAVSYLFADSLSFEVEFRNGSRVLLEDNGDTIRITNPRSENPRKIKEFNVLGVLDIMLPKDAVGIHCLAPWWNSTEIMRASTTFELTDEVSKCEQLANSISGNNCSCQCIDKKVSSPANN